MPHAAYFPQKVKIAFRSFYNPRKARIGPWKKTKDGVLPKMDSMVSTAPDFAKAHDIQGYSNDFVIFPSFIIHIAHESRFAYNPDSIDQCFR
jgi:hypothetical protein